MILLENKATGTAASTFSAVMAIAFLIGLVIFEFGFYTYFSQDGSPWLMMVVMNALYMVVAFSFIGGLSSIGKGGMALGYVIAIAGLYLIGISTLGL